MKRFLVLILATVMLLCCAVTVFATNHEVDFEVLLGIKAYVSSVEKLDVTVKQDYGTMTFVWTPAEATNMVFSLLETSVEGMTFTVEQGDTVVNSQNGQVSFQASAGTEVIIVVETVDYGAGTAILFGKQIQDGDISGDGKVDTLDGLLLMQYLNGWDITIPNPDAMDVSGDGKVDSLDGLLMMRYLNGWDVTLQ